MKRPPKMASAFRKYISSQPDSSVSQEYFVEFVPLRAKIKHDKNKHKER